MRHICSKIHTQHVFINLPIPTELKVRKEPSKDPKREKKFEESMTFLFQTSCLKWYVYPRLRTHPASERNIFSDRFLIVSLKYISCELLQLPALHFRALPESWPKPRFSLKLLLLHDIDKNLIPKLNPLLARARAENQKHDHTTCVEATYLPGDANLVRSLCRVIARSLGDGELAPTPAWRIISANEPQNLAKFCSETTSVVDKYQFLLPTF